MDALRMNLELMGYRIEDSRKEFQDEIAASRKEFQDDLVAMRKAFEDEIVVSRNEFRERTDVLMKAVSDLLIATGAVTSRVERIERRIA